MNLDLTTLEPLAASLARAGLPALGTILGAAVPFPFNLMVGPAFNAISASMGVDPTAANAPQAVQAAVDADPAGAAAKLQTIEQAHKDAADALNEELRLRLSDVQNARATEVALSSASSPLANASAVVSTVIVAGFIGIVGVMLFHPVVDNGVVSVLVGTMATAFGAVVNFYLGSSAGSQAKSETLASLAKAPTVNAGPGSHVSGGVVSGARR